MDNNVLAFVLNSDRVFFKSHALS